MKTNNHRKSFEEQMKRLEEIVAFLEKEDSDLDKSLKLYEEGLLLSQELQERLTKFETRIAELSQEGESHE